MSSREGTFSQRPGRFELALYLPIIVVSLAISAQAGHPPNDLKSVQIYSSASKLFPIQNAPVTWLRKRAPLQLLVTPMAGQDYLLD